MTLRKLSGVQTKPKASNNPDLALDISNDSTDFQARFETKTQESKQVKNSPWVEKFKTFCKISSVPEAKALLDSKFQTLSPVMLDKFLTHLR
jgi:CRISPR/Cas system endoribonuclease Cas6 (RAMP superfamily)